MAGPSFRSMHSCTVGRFSRRSACPSISYKHMKVYRRSSMEIHDLRLVKKCLGFVTVDKIQVTAIECSSHLE